MSPHHSIPEVTQSHVVYQGYFDVRIDHLLSQTGVSMSYTSLDIKVHAAAVLARTKDGKFVVNKEYRYPTGQWLLSCPGGRIDPGEDPVEAAIRELREETGYTGSKVTSMGKIFSLPAVTAQVIYYVLVEDAEKTQETAHEPFELIHTELKTLEELNLDISRGSPVDAVLCTALFLSQYLRR